MKTKASISLLFVLIVLYGMSLLSLFVHNKGRNLVIEDYGIKLMEKIDSNDKYLFKEFQDYRLDKVFVVGVTLLALISNLVYNKGNRLRFMVEWFMLMTVLFLIKSIGMIVTIYPHPQEIFNSNNERICKMNYKHSTGMDMLFEAFEVFIWRNRVCYDTFMDSDMINATILGLLMMKHFRNIGMKIVVVLIWLMNIFVLMTLRVVYSMNMFITIVLSILIFLIYHYESMNGYGLFGYMLKRKEKTLVVEHMNKVDVIDDIEDISMVVQIDIISEEHTDEN
jgi:hypothetical protein